jgi:hypothetical protein
MHIQSFNILIRPKKLAYCPISAFPSHFSQDLPKKNCKLLDAYAQMTQWIGLAEMRPAEEIQAHTSLLIQL